MESCPWVIKLLAMEEASEIHYGVEKEAKKIEY